MTIEEILKTVEEMDRDEFAKLVYSEKFGDIMWTSTSKVFVEETRFEKKHNNIIYRYGFDDLINHYEDTANGRKAFIKKYILVMAYFKTLSKLIDKYEKLIDNIDNE